MADTEERTIPPGMREVVDTSGNTTIRYLIPDKEQLLEATPEQMRAELAMSKASTTPSQYLSKEFLDYAMNLPREIRDQAFALGETGMALLGGMVSPIAGAIAGTGKTYYDLLTKGAIDTKEADRWANQAAKSFSYQPTMSSAQSALETIGKLPEHIMGTGMGLPPIVSGINPIALSPTPGALGSYKAGIARDINQFSNDIFNAQRGITPGYSTLGTEFNRAFVTPRPSTYEMLAGVEPAQLPSTASYAVKPKGKGNWLEEHFGQTIFDNIEMPVRSIEPTFREWETVVPAELVENYKRELSKLADEYEPLPGRADELRKMAIDIVTQEWNQANPRQFVPNLDELKTINNAYNSWLEGPLTNYMQRQAGTGIKSDPFLMEIEKTGFNPLPKVGPTRSESRRQQALEVHSHNPLFNPEQSDVGKQTATTPAGIEAENSLDRMIMSDIAMNYLDENQRGSIPLHEAMYSLSPKSSEILEPVLNSLYDALINQRIKPENISNVSMQKIFSDMLKEEQARVKALQSDTKAYDAYKQKSVMALPGTLLPDGNKMIVFDQAMMQADPLGTIRAMSVDTKDLDHCVSHCGHNTGNPLYKDRYQPLVEPHTGKAPARAQYHEIAPDEEFPYGGTQYTRGIAQGNQQIASLRTEDGSAAATIGMKKAGKGTFEIDQIMGLKDGPVDAKYHNDIINWMNQNADNILRLRDNSYTYNHIGNPVDLREGVENLASLNRTINKDRLQELVEENHMHVTIDNDYEFSTWYKHVTGKDMDETYGGEPLSSLVHMNEFDQLKSDLGLNEDVGLMSPSELMLLDEFERFEKVAKFNEQQAMEKSLGRFVTYDALKEFANHYGNDLQLKAPSYETGSIKQFTEYRNDLRNRIHYAMNDSNEELVRNLKAEKDKVEAHIDNLAKAQEEKVNALVLEYKNKLPNVDNQYPAVSTSRHNDIINWRREFMHDPELAKTRISQDLADDLSVLTKHLKQIPTELHRSLLDTILSDNDNTKFAAMLDTIPSYKLEPRQHKAMMDTIVDWANYLVEKGPRNDSAELRQIHNELGLPNENPARIAIPNMDWDKAQYYRDLWHENDQNGYIADIRPEDTGFIHALLGNQNERAKLPREQHWVIVRVLTNPESTIHDINALKQDIQERNGRFGALMPDQRLNALSIISDWAHVNGINLNNEHADGGAVRMADGGIVSALDQSVKNPQANLLLNADLPTRAAIDLKARGLKKGGRAKKAIGGVQKMPPGGPMKATSFEQFRQSLGMRKGGSKQQDLEYNVDEMRHALARRQG